MTDRTSNQRFGFTREQIQKIASETIGAHALHLVHALEVGGDYDGMNLVGLLEIFATKLVAASATETHSSTCPAPDCCNCGATVETSTETALSDSKDVVTVLRNALKEFGRHTRECELTMDSGYLCVCGLDEALEYRTTAETSECHIRPHDFCSAGTCSTCMDAERYRFIRQSETRLDPFEEEVYGEVWKAILPKGCDEEKMDAAIDAGLKRLGVKTSETPP